MSEFNHQDGVSRRKVLECMTWCGTGVLWTIAGGVPQSLGITGEAQAAEVRGLTFLQISDSHVGFDKPANPHALGTLEEAIAKINALPQKPAFMIHTGDISHLSKEKEFDDADQIISQSRLDVHYVPASMIFLTRIRRSIASATVAPPRAPAGTASTRTACTSSAWSMSSIFKRAVSAISAPSSLNG